MPRFQKKPIIIEANQFFINNPDCPGVEKVVDNSNCPSISYVVKTANGYVNVNDGDWIIKEQVGSGYYPCTDLIFKQTYIKID